MRRIDAATLKESIERGADRLETVRAALEIMEVPIDDYTRLALSDLAMEIGRAQERAEIDAEEKES